VGIQIAQQVFPSHIPNVAVFDTAFHSTMPSYAYTYPIPKEYRDDYAIRKYGFHGTSVQYVSKRGEAMVRSQLASPSTAAAKIKLIVAHLGNGASVTAVVDGKSMDTTMEFTPLSGIMMGTRSGSIDPTIVPFASKFMNKTPDEVLNDLNKKSGLLGMCGNNDMRNVLTLASQGDDQAALAAEMFVYILAKHIASLLVACGGTIDALIFTAGIGENSAYIRRETVSRLSPLLGHVILDEDHNNTNGKKSGGIISQASLDTDPVAKPLILVIPTDEEAMICLECERLVHNHDI
jgi:acetate kinase